MGDTAPPVDVPLALKGSDGRRRVLLACNEVAMRLNLYPGMTVAQAQSLISELVILDADPEAEAIALEKLAVWALKLYSPVVAADPPDGLVLNIEGAAHLHGGEAGLIDDLRTRLSALGIASRAALADTWGAAHALARFCKDETVIIAPGQSAQALVRLPVQALRLQSDIIPDLLLLGLDTIGELSARPRAPLIKSFGPTLFRRIDQAFGRLAEPIEPIRVSELISVERVFAEPIGAPETIEKYTRRLVEAICARLEDAGLGSRRLDLHFTRVDNRIETIVAFTAKPVRNVKQLSRLLVDKIETVNPGFGIEKMVMVAALAEPLVPTQAVASFTEAPKPDVEDLWNILANRYGPDRLYRAVSVATDIPERAVKRLPPESTLIGSMRNSRFRRPKRLYRKPETIQALAVLPDHPPRAFSWRGQRYSVRCADGPERVYGEWWVSDREKGKCRDYFILEVESGERFWAFRTGDGQHAETGSLNWYMHGKFD